MHEGTQGRETGDDERLKNKSLKINNIVKIWFIDSIKYAITIFCFYT